MHSIRGEGLLYKPTCGPCRPVQPAFASKRSSQAQRLSLVRTAASEQNAQPSQHTTVPHDQSRSQPVYHLAVDISSATSKLDAAKTNSPVSLTALAALAGVALAALAIKKVFDTPSRAYKENVGQEYDSWTDDGVLEYYWGEHIHLGYYTGMSHCVASCSRFTAVDVCKLFTTLSCTIIVLTIICCNKQPAWDFCLPNLSVTCCSTTVFITVKQ